MKNLILIATVASLFIAQSALGAKTEKSKSDKNIVFIVVDDLNTTLGCYGHPVIKTPNIDRLAERGARFNHAYCNYPVCGPSRGSFLTGLLPETIGILNNTTPLQDVLGDGLLCRHYLNKMAIIP
jgi:iduronate 2-sulfatase